MTDIRIRVIILWLWFLKEPCLREEKSVFKDAEKDQYGHAKLGGIGEIVSEKLKEVIPEI